jgi:hypothetical protein
MAWGRSKQDRYLRAAPARVQAALVRAAAQALAREARAAPTALARAAGPSA